MKLTTILVSVARFFAPLGNAGKRNDVLVIYENEKERERERESCCLGLAYGVLFLFEHKHKAHSNFFWVLLQSYLHQIAKKYRP